VRVVKAAYRGVVNDLEQIQRWIAAAERLVVLTGAGISTDSGIQDFRGPNGLWTKNPAAEKTATLQHYVGSAEVRKAAWQNRVNTPIFGAQPNDGHRALAALDDGGRLHALITQNVDGLHQAAGVDPAKVIEVHGTVHEWGCLDCDEGGPMKEALDRVRAGEEDPRCPTCGGIIKSRTISFGQGLVPEVIARAEQVATEADLLLAIGTTLSVYPVAGVVPLARSHGARVVILNAEPTDMDALADEVVRGSISELLPVLLGVDVSVDQIPTQ
jgi:NAD-dependent deacetylase